MSFSNLIKELSWVEWGAVIFTAINVWLTVKADIRNFAFGIVSVLLYAWVFWQGKLYANFALQLAYYLPMQFAGWWIWLKWGPNANDDLPIRRLTPTANVAWAAVTLLATAAWGYLIARMTDGHIPYWDAASTALSIVGQYLLTRKWLENWIYWILADIIYVFILFPSQHLYLSTGLYAVLMMMSAQGLVSWIRAEKKGAVHA